MKYFVRSIPRLALTGAMLFAVYGETGPWTALLLTLVTARLEIVDWLAARTNRELSEASDMVDQILKPARERRA